MSIKVVSDRSVFPSFHDLLPKGDDHFFLKVKKVVILPFKYLYLFFTNLIYKFQDRGFFKKIHTREYSVSEKTYFHLERLFVSHAKALFITIPFETYKKAKEYQTSKLSALIISSIGAANIGLLFGALGTKKAAIAFVWINVVSLTIADLIEKRVFEK